MIVDSDGTIAGVEIVNQVPYTVLPEIFIRSATGSGAVLSPIVNLDRSPREYRLLQVIDCLSPAENLQIIDTGKKVTVKRATITRPDGTTSTVVTKVGDTGEFIPYVPKPVSEPQERKVINPVKEDEYIESTYVEEPSPGTPIRWSVRIEGQ